MLCWLEYTSLYIIETCTDFNLGGERPPMLCKWNKSLNGSLLTKFREISEPIMNYFENPSLSI
jgi:hypothetical protein